MNDEFPADELGAFNLAGPDLMARRTTLKRDQGFELVAPVRRGGQPEPAARSCRLHARRERHGGRVMALVDYDQAVSIEERWIVPARQALDHSDVDDSGRLVLPAPDLADVAAASPR